MIRIDGFYLYSAGYSIHPLSTIQQGAAFQDSLYTLFIAQSTLEMLLERSVFQLQTSRAAGQKLLDALKPLTADPQRAEPIDFMEAYNVTSALNEFEHVLNAEFGMMNIYIVMKKRGYDTLDLIQRGIVLFPPELSIKVPESVEDINTATQCIAYELPTAAGFHLHRANESVLHRYYDAVTNNALRPAGRSIGEYLAEMRNKGVGQPIVTSALKDLKDLHRNPLIHPEHSLETVDEAIALLGSIQAAVVHMLKEIPEPPQVLPPAGSSATSSTS